MENIKGSVVATSSFKSQAKKAIFSIILFAFVYLLLVGIALTVTALCVYFGFLLIIRLPGFITLAVGVGAIGMGAFVLFFLVKFIFSRHKSDMTGYVEIHASDEPRLFGLLKDLVEKVGTAFPRKVYLSSDVNASVFYDSSFWSMFFPIKKNLVIGMGLVNTVTTDEFRAILAHEFGHFSQRSMKVGSFVYNVNQVIFNMLYDNDSYERALYGWASVSWYFTFFAKIAVKIIEAIKWVLRKMYELVNISYMGLSREMEFHADEIAAHVTGYLPLKTSLLRGNFADHAMNEVFNFYGERTGESIKSANIYPEQLFVLNFLAEHNNIPVVNNLPMINLEEASRYNKSRLVVKDQWASHPSVGERIGRMEKLTVPDVSLDATPANEIFVHLERYHQEFTQMVFSHVEYKDEVTVLSIESFKEKYTAVLNYDSFPKVFNGYYDKWNPLPFDPAKVESNGELLSAEELFSEKNAEQVFLFAALENDMGQLQQIADGVLKVKTFDYDGKKYRRRESKKLKGEVQREYDALKEKLFQNDLDVFRFFKNLESVNGKQSALDQQYTDFFGFDTTFHESMKLYSKLGEKLQFIYQNTPFDQIRSNFRNLEPLEKQLKEDITSMLSHKGYAPILTREIRECFEKYTAERLVYFAGESYYNENLDVLFTAMRHYASVLYKRFFMLKKQLLEYKAELLPVTSSAN